MYLTSFSAVTFLELKKTYRGNKEKFIRNPVFPIIVWSIKVTSSTHSCRGRSSPTLWRKINRIIKLHIMQPLKSLMKRLKGMKLRFRNFLLNEELKIKHSDFESTSWNDFESMKIHYENALTEKEKLITSQRKNIGASDKKVRNLIRDKDK